MSESRKGFIVCGEIKFVFGFPVGIGSRFMQQFTQILMDLSSPMVKRTAIALLLMVSASSPSFAQSQSQRDTLEEPELQEPLPTLEELFPTLKEPTTPPESSLEIPDRIVVRKFLVLGSTVFEDSEFTTLLAAFRNRPITFSELLQAQEAVTKKYVEAGYITSGAYIPPQTLDQDVVEIQVVEGSVDEIRINGLQRLREGYLKSRLALATKAPLHQGDLLQALQVLQLDPLIQRLSVELAAGVRPGSSILAVDVTEADAFAATLGLDNQRSPSVGSVRRQVGFNHNNLLGFGDRLNVAYINTEGSNSLDNFGYTFPINAGNGTLGYRHSRTSSNIIEQPFNLVDIESESRLHEVTLRQPLLQTPNQDFAMGVSFAHQKSQTFILGNIGFPLSSGASNDGITRISALRFFQEYSNRDSNQVFALRSQLNLGIQALNSTINNGIVPEPDSKFWSWRGQAQYLRLVTPDTTLLVRQDLQLAGDALLPAEQFSVGGAVSVRGYRQDALLADNGLFGSVEVRTPIAKIPNWNSRLELTPFVDWGALWNHQDNQGTVAENFVWSVGLGLRWLMGNHFNARLDWGIPMVELQSSGDTLQENGVYFSMEYSFF